MPRPSETNPPDDFFIGNTPHGVIIHARKGKKHVITQAFGLPAAAMRAFIHAIKQFGSVILPTKDGTYIVDPVQGCQGIVGRTAKEDKKHG